MTDKRRWNPADFIGYSERAGINSGPRSDAQALEPASIDDLQNSLRGEEPTSVVRDGELMNRSMGLTPEDQKFLQNDADKRFYSSPVKQQLIKDLGLEVKDGIPVLDIEDDKSFNETENLDQSKWTTRQKLLNDLLVDD